MLNKDQLEALNKEDLIKLVLNLQTQQKLFKTLKPQHYFTDLVKDKEIDFKSFWANSTDNDKVVLYGVYKLRKLLEYKQKTSNLYKEYTTEEYMKFSKFKLFQVLYDDFDSSDILWMKQIKYDGPKKF